MKDYFASSDVLLISLVNEPIFNITVPAKFQDYLVARKPIFSIMKGEVSRMVVENNLGLACDPNNIKGIKNGFLYQIQDVTNDSGSSVVMTEFLYKNIKVSTAEVESDSGKSGEMSEEELEKLVKPWEHYDQMISEVITKTIVMVGR